MLDDYFTRPEILRRHRAGFFGAYLDTYTSMAKEHGYPRQSVRCHCHLVRRFGRWLERRGLSVGALDEGVVAEFWRKKRGEPRVRQMGTKVLRSLVEHLRAQAVVPEQSAPERTEAAALAHRYGEYLEQRRALTVDTVRRQVPVALQFLQSCFGRGPLRLHALGEEGVTRFVLGTADSVSRRTHQTQMSILRSFFRFLLERGEIELDLAALVNLRSKPARLCQIWKTYLTCRVDSRLPLRLTKSGASESIDSSCCRFHRKNFSCLAWTPDDSTTSCPRASSWLRLKTRSCTRRRALPASANTSPRFKPTNSCSRIPVARASERSIWSRYPSNRCPVVRRSRSCSCRVSVRGDCVVLVAYIVMVVSSGWPSGHDQ